MIAKADHRPLVVSGAAKGWLIAAAALLGLSIALNILTADALDPDGAAFPVGPIQVALVLAAIAGAVLTVRGGRAGFALFEAAVCLNGLVNFMTLALYDVKNLSDIGALLWLNLAFAVAFPVVSWLLVRPAWEAPTGWRPTTARPVVVAAVPAAFVGAGLSLWILGLAATGLSTLAGGRTWELAQMLAVVLMLALTVPGWLSLRQLLLATRAQRNWLNVLAAVIGILATAALAVAILFLASW
jgi:hypothetical protein